MPPTPPTPDPVAFATFVVAVVAVIIALIAAGVAFWQVRITRFISGGDQFTEAMKMLQAEENRQARGWLYRFNDQGKDFEHWTDEERRNVEKVCSVYLQVGFMLKNSYLPLKRFLPYTDRTVGDCYMMAEPLINHRRTQEGRQSLFKHFEWLAREEEKFYRKKQWWEKWRFKKLRRATEHFTEDRAGLKPTMPAGGAPTSP